MSFIDTFTQMTVLFMVVIIGFICHKLKIMNDTFDRSLSVLIINVTAPCIILSSVMGEKLPQSSEILPVFLLGTATLLVMLILGFIATKLMKVPMSEAGMFYFMFSFGNINFIGIPVATALFGTYAIFYISVLTIPFNILLFLLGQIFISSCRPQLEQNQQATKISFNWRTLFSPALVSTYIVILLVYFQVHTPKAIGEALTLVGYMTIPASLLVIGSALANIKVKDMLGTKDLYILCGLKLLVFPLLIYVLYLLTPFEHKYTDVLVILAAMPVASYGTMLCLKEGINPRTMAQGTFLSTLLSIVSIPLLALIMQSLAKVFTS